MTVHEKNRDLEELLAHSFPFWNELGEADREDLLHASHRIRFEKGTNVHNGN